MAPESLKLSPRKTPMISLTSLRASLSTRIMALALSIAPATLLTSGCEEGANREIHVWDEYDGGDLRDIPNPGSTSDAGNSENPDAVADTDTAPPSPDASATPDPDASNNPDPDTGNNPNPDAANNPDPDASNNPNPDASSIPDPDANNNPTPDAEIPPEQSCGDGICDEAGNECAICPEDCQGPTDCDPCGDGECNQLFESSQTCPEDCGPFCVEDADCDDGIPCTTDVCVDQIDCDHIPNNEVCDDNIDCTSDICDMNEGCINQAFNQACNDADLCTENICNPMAGCENPPLDENDILDEDLCTIDSCDPILGIRHVPVECPGNDICNPATGLCTDPDLVDPDPNNPNPDPIQPVCADPSQIVEIETYTAGNATIHAVDTNGTIIAAADECSHPQNDADVICYQTCLPESLAVIIAGTNQLIAASAPDYTMGVKLNYEADPNEFPDNDLVPDVVKAPGATFHIQEPDSNEPTLFITPSPTDEVGPGQEQ